MLAYIVRRLLLMIPTLFGIMVLNFVIVQFAPGGPVEQAIAELKGTAVASTEIIIGGQSDLGTVRDPGLQLLGHQGLGAQPLAQRVQPGVPGAVGGQSGRDPLLQLGNRSPKPGLPHERQLASRLLPGRRPCQRPRESAVLGLRPAGGRLARR